MSRKIYITVDFPRGWDYNLFKKEKGIFMILIISKSRKDARSLAEMFHIMGVIAYAATPSEALSEISLTYSAAIVMNPSLLPAKDEYVVRLRRYASIPIFAYSDTEAEDDRLIFDGIIKSTSYASSALLAVSEHNIGCDIKAPGVYKLAGIDASAALPLPLYFERPLPLTKTEAMILRTLIVSYPNPMGAKEILKYAFRQTRTPEIANIRTHISVINKKFREISGRNLIALSVGEGYVVLTPELIQKSEEALIK